MNFSLPMAKKKIQMRAVLAESTVVLAVALAYLVIDMPKKLKEEILNNALITTRRSK